MNFYFKKIIALAVLFLSLSVFVEWHSDHDANAQGSDVCCVQCCPSHHLAPLSQNSAVVKSSHLFGRIVRDNLQLYLEYFPSAIDRPPIV